MNLKSCLIRMRAPFLHFGNDALHREIFGIDFISPVGLGAGVDPEGVLFDAYRRLGVSFITTGPVSPENAVKCAGNTLHEDSPCVLAFDICKSEKSKEDQDIVRDISGSFSLLYDFAEMLVLDCRDEVFDFDLIQDVVSACRDESISYDTYKPVIVSVGDSLDPAELGRLSDFLMMNGIDGMEISGIERIKAVSEHTKGRFPIIGRGEIESPGKALEMLDAGASLIALSNELDTFGTSYIKKLLGKIWSSLK